jgi:glutamate/tyrosine decarboxylase-like PLP-dependent enzyme
MDDPGMLLHRVAEEATTYLCGLASRPVAVTAGPDALAGLLPVELPAESLAARDVLDEVLALAEDGVVATGSPRYFGFVIGGALPAAIAADWMATVWDQNAGLYASGPAAAVLEGVAGRWILDVLDLPPAASFAVVTGCQMAHVTCLAAARHRVLANRGWDVEVAGLRSAPRLRVLVGELAHVTVARALRLLGVGSSAIEVVPVDHTGGMRPDVLESMLDGAECPTIVCVQLGEVNTGAMDPVGAIIDVAHAAGAWVHVDGAFGLWARVSSQHRHLTDGVDRADSWATDAHKWLNVPYDCGLAICAHPEDHYRAMAVHADYLPESARGRRDGVDWTPEFSRRARGTALYAALRFLGRDGIAALVDGCCAAARRFASGLEAVESAEVLNNCVLNQVLVRFGDDRRTTEVIDRLQRSGECWMSATNWDGGRAMRISVVNWRTTAADVDRSLAAIVRAVSVVNGS